MANYDPSGFYAIKLSGDTYTPDTTECNVKIVDEDGYIVFARDNDVPSGEAGYAVGCIFIDQNASGVANIFLVNEGDETSCSFVTSTAATTFNALTDTNLNPATATAGTVPCVVGGVLTAKAGLVFGTTTATSGNVLVANGTTWGTSTLDGASIVAKTGNQTIAGNKTFSGTTTLGIVSAGDDITLADSKLLYLGDTDSFLYSPSAGTVELKAKLTSGGLMTIDGYALAVGATSAGGLTLGATSGAGALSLLFTGNFTCYGAAASTMNFGATAQTGTMTYGETSGTMTANFFTGTGANTVNLATGAGAKVVTIGSTNGASSLTLAMGTGNFSLAGAAASTITIGKSDQSGKISIGDSTGALQIDVGVGGTAVKTVNIASEATQAHIINIGGAASLPVISGSTVTVDASTLFDVNGDMDLSGDLTALDVEAEQVVADIVAQNKMYWCDDFMEAANVLASTVYSKCHWAGAGTNGTQTITAATNGVIILSTTATGSSTSTLTYNGANTTDNDLNPVFEAHMTTDDITNTKVNCGFYADANDYIMFEFDTADDAANIYLVTNNNGGGEVAQDTGVDIVAGTYNTFTIEIAADDSYEVFIDGVQVCETPTGSIRDVSFKPYFYVDNKAAAEEKKLSVDYCKFWQDRA